MFVSPDYEAGHKCLAPISSSFLENGSTFASIDETLSIFKY